MTEKAPFPATPVDDWPAYDRAIWESAMRKAIGIFHDRGFAATWRPATLRGVERGYGTYLRWLKIHEGNLDPHASVLERVDEERIDRFIAEYATGRSPLTVATTVRGIAYVCRCAAPPDGLSWLTKLAHSLTNSADRVRSKAPRMAPIADLVDLGELLMDGGRRKRCDGMRGSDAVQFRDGLMIALLARRPLMRVRNLFELRIGHNLVFRGSTALLDFPSDERKNGRATEVFIPEDLTRMVREYIDDYRSFLTRKLPGPDEGWMWVSRRGFRMCPTEVTQRITTLTKRHLDRPVSPHLFRDCAATDIAIHAPTDVGITADILGHATLRTSEKYYNRADGFAAMGRHADLIARLRRS